MKTKNPQTKKADFSFGSKEYNEFYHGRNKDKKKSAPHKLTKGKIRKDEEAAHAPERAAYQATQKRIKAQLIRNDRILGPSGKAQAVKIARKDLQPFDFNDVDKYESEGWKVVGAGVVAARRIERNPAPLGEDGQARALILLGKVDAKMLEHLSKVHHLDTYPAPKAYREGMKKNPEYGDHRKAERAALKKAEAFFGPDGPKTPAKPLRGYETPTAAVEIGTLTAIEYESNKFDGESRIYRHDVVSKRKLFISIDGSTIIVWPPLKLTKRGIEG